MEKTYKHKGKMYEVVEDEKCGTPEDPCFSCGFWRDEDLERTECIAPSNFIKICCDSNVVFKEV